MHLFNTEPEWKYPKTLGFISPRQLHSQFLFSIPLVHILTVIRCTIPVSEEKLMYSKINASELLICLICVQKYCFRAGVRDNISEILMKCFLAE